MESRGFTLSDFRNVFSPLGNQSLIDPDLRLRYADTDRRFSWIDGLIYGSMHIRLQFPLVVC